MNDTHVSLVATELGLKPAQVLSTADLLGGGATVPFIARYRKEATGSLDEVAIAAIRDRLEQLAELDRRRSAIVASLTERNLLTPELTGKLERAQTVAQLEDIYLPFRPKRRTRATMARERGLEPLATLLFAQGPIDPGAEAARFVDEAKGVASADDALAGARDIIAEWVSEDARLREEMRGLFAERGLVASRVAAGKETEGAKFRDYFDWKEPIGQAPSHRILAMLRGENEGFLKLSVAPAEDQALELVRRRFVRRDDGAGAQVWEAAQDGYKRLLAPSMENETRQAAKEKADAEAIRVFAGNVRQLLLAPPLGPKAVLAIDPGFRTGCKVVCMDRQGKLLHHDVIFPHTGEGRQAEASRTVVKLCAQFGVEVIAIGNGTAGRETEAFVRGLELPGSPPVVLVNESGASIYSASEVARQEFPDHDVTVRGAVSIGRRLQDPLAELVKIDPKSIGVGQYQHDVDQGQLKKSLDDVVESCVNAVGVDVNTASPQLLTYVSGLGPQLARNIVAWRNENGAFASRKKLRDVPRLGAKAFEQCAGFLRIAAGDNPLDASAVHPESYAIVDRMAADLGCTVGDLLHDESLRSRIVLDRYVSDAVGLPTLRDIAAELAKPGRDPRERFEILSFTEGVNALEDLEPGMKLPGVVTNVTAFGAFVDVGVHQDGLVHVSQLADRFVKDPNEVVKVQQRVTVTVISVDRQRRRIGLSMRSNPRIEGAAPAGPPAAGARPAAGAQQPPPRPGRPGQAPRPERPGASGGPDSSGSRSALAEQLEEWQRRHGRPDRH